MCGPSAGSTSSERSAGQPEHENGEGGSSQAEEKEGGAAAEGPGRVRQVLAIRLKWEDDSEELLGSLAFHKSLTSSMSGVGLKIVCCLLLSPFLN
jgi:hypothetical protein